MWNRSVRWITPFALASVSVLSCTVVAAVDHGDGGPDDTPPTGAAGPVDAGIDARSVVAIATNGQAGEPSDAAEADGGSSCGAYVFCDGFEQGLINWSSHDLSGGTLTVDSVHVYRGTHALHAHIDPVVEAGATAAALIQRFQEWPTHLFARFFAYQPSPRPPSPANYADLVALNSPYSGIALSTDPPGGALAMNTFSTGQDQTWESDGGVMPTDQWVCFEVDLDTVAETSHLYMNDVEVTDMSQGMLALPGLGNLGVGLSFYLPSVQGAQDAWIDEVAVSASRIGCTDAD
jgi:hypothetical protein